MAAFKDWARLNHLRDILTTVDVFEITNFMFSKVLTAGNYTSYTYFVLIKVEYETKCGNQCFGLFLMPFWTDKRMQV